MAATELMLALATFCAVTLFTPGPNNLMLMASGLNYGFRRSLPHFWGVNLGFALMVLLVGLGLGKAFELYPLLYTALKHAGAAYLLYLAWEIATAGPVDVGGASRGRPITFLEAAAFQWVNPKGWVMAVGSVSAYAAIAPFPWNMILIAALFGTLGMASSGTWVGFGTALQHVLTDPRHVRVFNVAMALLLVASLWPILAEIAR